MGNKNGKVSPLPKAHEKSLLINILLFQCCFTKKIKSEVLMNRSKYIYTVYSSQNTVFAFVFL